MGEIGGGERLGGVDLSRMDVDAVARRVVELLDENGHGNDREATVSALSRFADAATVARLLGVSRATVYAKADQLGAIRVGNGPRARLRFDLSRVVSAVSPQVGPETEVRRSRNDGNQSRHQDRDLLPIRGGRTGSSRRLRS